MQPSWRKEGASLTRDVPQGENWETLMKGGSSGIYIIVIGLSWWIKTQCSQHDPDAWTLVNDLSWVIQQMKIGIGSGPPIPQNQKRARDADTDSEKEAEPRKR